MALLATRVAPEVTYAFFDDNRHHHQGGDRIGPPPSKHCVQHESALTELLEFTATRQIQVYRCFRCGNVWSLPAEPAKPK